MKCQNRNIYIKKADPHRVTRFTPSSSRLRYLLAFNSPPLAFSLSQFPFLSYLFLFLPSPSLSPPPTSPSYPICYLPAGSVFTLHCRGPVRIQGGWVTHSQSASLSPSRRQPHPRTPLLYKCTHRCTSVHAHTHSRTSNTLRKCKASSCAYSIYDKFKEKKKKKTPVPDTSLISAQMRWFQADDSLHYTSFDKGGNVCGACISIQHTLWEPSAHTKADYRI